MTKIYSLVMLPVAFLLRVHFLLLNIGDWHKKTQKTKRKTNVTTTEKLFQTEIYKQRKYSERTSLFLQHIIYISFLYFVERAEGRNKAINNFIHFFQRI